MIKWWENRVVIAALIIINKKSTKFLILKPKPLIKIKNPSKPHLNFFYFIILLIILTELITLEGLIKKQLCARMLVKSLAGQNVRNDVSVVDHSEQVRNQ